LCSDENIKYCLSYIADQLHISNQYNRAGGFTFCQNPLKFTCPDNGEAGKIREEKIDRIELELKTVAFSNTSIEFENENHFSDNLK
jgi:hypothetical protein